MGFWDDSILYRIDLDGESRFHGDYETVEEAKEAASQHIEDTLYWVKHSSGLLSARSKSIFLWGWQITNRSLMSGRGSL